MVDAHRREQWNHTSHLLAWMENTSFGRKGQITSASERNPMVAKANKGNFTVRDLDEMAGL